MSDFNEIANLFESDPQAPGDQPGVTVFPVPTAPAPKKKPRKEDYPALARSYAEKYGLDPDIFERQIKQESGFNPYARSPKGALGMSQFMPATGRRYGLVKSSDFLNADKSLDAGARYHSDLLKKYNGNQDLVLAAYNAGEGAVDDYLNGTNLTGKNPRLRKTGGIPPFRETQNYIKAIRGASAKSRDNIPSGIPNTASANPPGIASLFEPNSANAAASIADLFEPDPQANPSQLPTVASGLTAVAPAAPTATAFPAEMTPGTVQPPQSPAQQPQSAQPALRTDAKGNPLTWDGYPAIRNSDGSVTTEESITVTDPQINNGRPTNIPSVWRGERLPQEEAIRSAVNSKQSFPAFGSISEAVKVAQERSAQKGRELDDGEPQSAQPGIYDLFSDILGLSPESQQPPPGLEPIEAGPGEPPPDFSAQISDLGAPGQPPLPRAAKPALRDIPTLKQSLAAKQADLKRQAFVAKYGGPQHQQEYEQAVADYNGDVKTYNGVLKRHQQHAAAPSPSSELLDRAAVDISDFEAIRKQAVDLRAQGDDLHATFALRQAFDKAAQIRDRYGKHVEVGTGEGGWPYIKPVGWGLAQAGKPATGFAPEAQARGAQIGKQAAYPQASSRFYEPTGKIIEGQANAPAEHTAEIGQYEFGLSEANDRAANRYYRAQTQKKLGEEEDARHGMIANAIRHGVQNVLAGAGETATAIGGAAGAVLGKSPLGLLVKAIRPETGEEADTFRKEMLDAAEETRNRNAPESFVGAALYQAGRLLPKLAVPGGVVGFGVAEAADAIGHDESPAIAVKRGLAAIATGQLGGMLGKAITGASTNPIRAYFSRAAGYGVAPAAVTAATEAKLPDSQQLTRDMVFGMVFAFHGSKWHADLDPINPPRWFDPVIDEGVRQQREAGMSPSEAERFVQNAYKDSINRSREAGISPKDTKASMRDLVKEVKQAIVERESGKSAPSTEVAPRETPETRQQRMLGTGEEPPEAVDLRAVEPLPKPPKGGGAPQVIPLREGEIVTRAEQAFKPEGKLREALQAKGFDDPAIDKMSAEDARQAIWGAPQETQAAKHGESAKIAAVEASPAPILTAKGEGANAETVYGNQEELRGTRRTGEESQGDRRPDVYQERRGRNAVVESEGATERLTEKPEEALAPIERPAEARFKEGDQVSHPVFAKGEPLTVKSIEGGTINVEMKRKDGTVKPLAIKLDSKIGRELQPVSEAGAEPIEKPAHTQSAVPTKEGEIVSEESPRVQGIEGIVKREREEKRKIEAEAATDKLTGLQNQNQWKAAQPRIDADPNLHIARLDINRLKAVNDTHGHQAGDAYIEQAGKIIGEEATKAGVSPRLQFRSGTGDEFTLAGPQKAVTEAAKAIQTRIASEVKLPDGSTGSIAYGVARREKAADVLMYAQKKSIKSAISSETTKAAPIAKTATGPIEGKPAESGPLAKRPTRADAIRLAQEAAARKIERREATKRQAQEKIEAAKGKRVAEKPATVETEKEAAGTKPLAVETKTAPRETRTPSRVTKSPTAESRRKLVESLNDDDLWGESGQASLTPRGWQIAETTLKPVKEDLRAEYQWRPNRQYVALNAAGLRALVKAYGRPTMGLTLNRPQAERIAAKARAAAETATGLERDNLNGLAAAIDDALTHAEEFAIYAPGLRRRKTARHEATHIAQLALQRFFQDAPTVEGIKKLPGYEAVLRGLAKRGYTQFADNPRALAHEAAAHIAGGQWELIGLNLRQGLEFLDGYFKLLGRMYGADALKRFDQLNGKFARLRDAVIERIREEETGTAARQAQAGVRGAPEGRKAGAVAADSEEPGDAEGEFEEIAWHGSPYRFDRFSKEKIGTGEGAQAYGYGLYFAGKKEVAEYYKESNIDRAIGMKDSFEHDGSYYYTERVFDGLAQFKEDLSIAHPGERFKKRKRIYEAEFREAYKAAHGDTSALYEVELAPKDDEYLLWDKPLSEQSEKIKQLLLTATQSEGSKEILRPYIKESGITQYRNSAGSTLYHSIEEELQSPQAASDYLHSLGIRGIKYLDNTSRGKGEGSFNYVIFSDEDVTIQEILADLAAIPLPPRVVSALVEITRSFIESGETDFDVLMNEIEDAVSADKFGRISPHLAEIIGAVYDKIEAAEQEQYEANARKADTPAETDQRQRLYPPRPTSQPTGEGAATSISVPGTLRTYAAQYQARELTDVYPSHNPQTFQPNPDYELVNDRRYDREKSYQEDIVKNSRADTFIPKRLINNSDTAESGPPIIDQNGNVLGGNSRTMKLARIYAAGAGRDYKAELLKQANVYGLDVKQLAAMKQPVLVRLITDETLSKQDAVTELNVSGTRALAPTERAAAEANRMPDETVNYIADKIEQAGDDATLAQVLDRSGVEIANRLIADGVFATQERNALINDKGLLPEARKRIERMMQGRIYRDLEQLERAPESIKRNTERIIAPLLRIEGLSGWDILDSVRNAIDLVTEARAASTPNLEEFARQPSMFRAHEYDPREVALAEALTLGPVKTAMAFKKYANEAMNAERGGGLFGALTPAQAFADAFKSPRSSSVVTTIATTSEPKPIIRNYGTIEAPNVPALSEAFAEDFMTDRRFATIVEARSRAGELLGGKVSPGTETAKRIDEAVELGVVRAARQIVREPGQSPEATFDRLVALYDQQPTLGTKTSTSVRNQAYSTPAPIAYVASRLAGISGAQFVYEPTAGNGMLLIEAAPEKIVANEMNPERAAALRATLPGADIHQKDATEYMPVGVFNSVIANPPFGPLKDAEGNSKTFYPTGQYRTNEIDHAISLRALESLKDNGRAVLIVGGINAQDEAVRSDGYNGKSKRAFYLTLYGQYNVVDHFTIAGDLYRKQGAGWPVDVIVINRRGKSSRALPAVDVPRIYDSFDALKEVLDEAPTAGNLLGAAGQPESTRPGGGQVRGGPEARPGPVSEPALRPLREPADQGTELAAGARPGVRSAARGGVSGEQAGTQGGGQRTGIQQPAAPGGAITEGRAGASPEGAGAQRPRGEASLPRDQPESVAQPATRTPDALRSGIDLTQTQVAYRPHSAQSPADTLVPINMATATDEALARLEREVGNLDYFVAGELGYRPEEIGKYFNAEQVDALALAIRAMQTGAGFIIGDQTGIGKGRVVAGVMRYALRTDRTPIFVTEKPNLYKDIYRDLIDIGMSHDELRPIMTNSGERIALTDDESVMLRAKEGAAHRKELSEMAANRDLGDHNIIFTTYSQMQTVKGARTARMDFLDAFARGGVLILDESHNAGGTEAKPRGKEVNEMNRAKFARGLVDKASGVFYSSATYAKRPQVMDLYSKTDMRLAVKAGGLAEAIEKGGVPLQQAVASQLVESGQYIRRERSFEGVNYNTEPVAVDKRTAENISGVMRSIRNFDQAKQSAIENAKKQAKAEAKAILGETATGAAGVSSTNFTSLMHNLVDQMLLGLKADAAVSSALAALARGEKPVITVANTMGSFIEHYVEDNDLKPGDAIALDFGDMLLRYLERSRDILVGNAFGQKERRRLTDNELGANGLAAYDSAKELIGKTDWSKIPVSPIDYIKSKLEQEGYRTGEITGRSHTVDYKGATPVYRMRPGGEISIAGRNRTITRFNGGETDVMVLNQAGATGLSLHASAKFKDRRKRHMIIAQAERNIDTHMQMLGRVHRTGQVVLPEYTQLAADIPAEKRPAAILAKKMASLNANTTAARGSAVTAKGVTDFMNDYGDEIAAALMSDNPDLHAKLGGPLKPNQSGEGLEVEGAIRKVTGRIPLLRIKEQEELYNLIEDEYNDLIQQLDALGENALEAKNLDLDAKPIKATVVFEGAGDRPFTRSARAELMDVKLVGRPYTSEQIIETLQGETGSAESDLVKLRHTAIPIQQKQMRNVEMAFDAYISETVDEIEDEPRRRAQEERLKGNRARWHNTMIKVTPGTTVKLTTKDSDYYAIVLKVEQKGKPKNPVALGSWKVTFAVADSMRRLTLPFSKINGVGENQVKLEHIIETEGLYRMPVIDFFDHSQQQSREKRTIITGNLLAGFGRFKAGKIVNFSDHAGNVRQGVLMPRDWSIEKAMDAEPIDFASADQVLRFLEQTNAIVQASDKLFSVSRRGSDYRFFTPASKSTGGRYFLNQPLIAAAGMDFVKAGDMMQVITTRAQAVRVIEEAQRQGVTFQANAFKDAARQIAGKPKPKPTGADEPMADLEPFADLAPPEERPRRRRPPVIARPTEAPAPLTGSLTAGVKAGWDKFLNFAVRNLSHLRRISPTAQTAALRAAGSRGQATVLLQLATAKIHQALEGSGISWGDLRAAMVESRLRGIAKRYQGFADRISETADEDLESAMRGGMLNVIGHIQGRAGLDDTLAQSAAGLLQSGRYDDLREFLIDAFEAAAGRVGQALEPEDYDRITGNAKFKAGLRLYKSLIEQPIAESHAINEGIFSDALGPLDTYYPLVAVKDDGGILHRIFGVGKYPYRKPKNIANAFATGLATPGYSTEAADFAERITAAIRTNNKANLMSELDRQGLIRVLGPKEKAPDEETLGGEYGPAVTVETRADLIVLRDGKQTRVPAARAIVPAWLHKELKPILERERLEPGMGASLINKIIHISLIGPLDLVFHSTNVVGALVANTPFVGQGLIGKTIGNLPLTKIATAMLEMVRVEPLTGPMTERTITDLTEMANLGLIPPRYGSRTISSKFIELTGAKRGFSSAFLYGPKGLDIRARLVMYRVAKMIEPNATPQSLFDFVTQLGVYNRELESLVERWAKGSRLAPFATAGMSMLRNGINAWVGLSGSQPIPVSEGGSVNTIYTWKTASGETRLVIPGGGGGKKGGGPPPGVPPDASISEESAPGGSGKRFAYRIAQALSGGAAGLLLLWAAAYKEYKKKYPWQDPEARLLHFPLNPEDRNSKLGKMLFGDDPTKTAYVSLAFFSPLVARGGRALGLQGAFETRQLGGTAGQSLEYAQRDIYNSIAHPFASGPLVRAPFVFLTGKEPQITSLRDITGQFGPELYPATVKAAPGLSTLRQRAQEAILNVNPFFQAAAGAAGIGKESERKPGEKEVRPGAEGAILDRIVPRILKGALNLAAPRLLGSAVDTLARQERLEKERKAAESTARPKVNLPDDVRKAIHDEGVIPNAPNRKPDESDEDYKVRAAKSNEAVADRVRSLLQSDAYKGLGAPQRKQAIRDIIEDAHRDASTGRIPAVGAETELQVEQRLVQDRILESVKAREDFKALSKEGQESVTRGVSVLLERFDITTRDRKALDDGQRSEKARILIERLHERGAFDAEIERLILRAQRKAA